MLKIATWNVNSVRKRVLHLCDWLKTHSIDIALLQEIKCQAEQFPYEQLEALGYKCYVNGQKGRNGVAIVTKYPILSSSLIIDNIFKVEELESSLITQDTYNASEARYIECMITCNNLTIRLASIYVPNGQNVNSAAFEYKLKFLDVLYSHLSSLINNEEIIIVGGDYNVALDGIDVYSPEMLKNKLCFHIRERKKLRAILNLGFVDAFRILNEDAQHFSWWNYKARSWENNRGLRIDYLLFSPQAADRLKTCTINSQIRGLEIPSDHAPVESTLSLDIASNGIN